MKKSKFIALLTGGALALSLGITGVAGLTNSFAKNNDYLSSEIAVVSAAELGDNNVLETGKVYTLQDLKDIRDAVNEGSYTGTITLEADIDLGNEEWTPIGKERYFNGVFDGNGHTISNLKIDSTSQYTAFIGSFDKSYEVGVKNLTIENVDVKSTERHTAAVVGYQQCAFIENCTVTGDIKIEGNAYTGGIAGGDSAGDIINCSVLGNNGSYIKGVDGFNVGGISGTLFGKTYLGRDKYQYCVGNKVNNVDISGDSRVGGITGLLGTNESYLGIIVSGNSYTNGIVACTNATPENAAGHINVGGIIGEYCLVTDGLRFIVNNTVDNIVIKTPEIGTPEMEGIDHEIIGGCWDLGGDYGALSWSDVTRCHYEGNNFNDVQIVEQNSDATPKTTSNNAPEDNTQNDNTADNTQNDNTADNTQGDNTALYVVIALLSAATLGLGAYVFVLKKKSNNK